MGLRRKIFMGFIWQALEQFGTRIVHFVVAIILARLLGPEEFGTIALLSIFMFFASLLVDSGFGKALIQEKDVRQVDYDSIFYVNLLIGLTMYCLLFLCAPCIADFYDKPILIPVLRWSALGIVIHALNVVQIAVLEREMRFNCSFWISSVSTIVSGSVGVGMAYTGFGIWSLVASGLSGAIAGTTVRWIMVGWRPHLAFSIRRVKKFFSFGSKLLVSWTIGSVVSQSYGPIIGKCYSAADLAFFNRGESLPTTVMGCVESVISKVMFPALASVQNEKERLVTLTRRMMSFNTMIIFPTMIGLAALAEPTIRFLLTDKWIASVPFLQLACIYYACRPINVANVQVIQACGEGGLYFRLEMLKTTIDLLILLISLKFGIIAIAIGRVISAGLAILVNMKPCSRIIGYTYKMQFRDLLPYMVAAGIMGIVLWFLVLIMTLSSLSLLLILIPVGTLLYTVLLWMVKADAFMYALNLIKGRV